MFFLNGWPEHFPEVRAYDRSPKPAPVRHGDNTVAWIRVFSNKSGITPDVANEAFANCSRVAKAFDITLPDYCRAGTDQIGRTILIACHVEGTTVSPHFSGHTEAVRQISEFHKAYTADPIWHEAAIGDLYHEHNYRIDVEGNLRIIDVGDIFTAG